MNGRDIFRGMAYLDTKYIDQAEFSPFSAEDFEKDTIMDSERKKSVPRLFLLAAVIALVSLLVGCGIVYILSIQNLKLGDQQVIQERWDEENRTIVYETVSQQVLTFSGLKGSPNYEAAKEWYEFKRSYDPDWKIYHEQIDAGALDNIPEEYRLYNCYTAEMVEKADEIRAKYGLKLRGKLVKSVSSEALYHYLGMDGVLLPGAKAKADDFNTAHYDGGWFHTDMYMSLTENEDWPYQFLCSMYYSPKDCFDTTICELNDTEDWQEWNYTTASGDNLLVIRSPSVWFSWVFCDRGDATITLRIETIRELYTDEHGYQEVIQTPMTDDQLKEVMDCIDFSIKPQPGDASLLEGSASSKALTQTRNGYTVTVKDSFTDGLTVRVLLGITAPEDVDLEQYLAPDTKGFLNFSVATLSPQHEGIALNGGGGHGAKADNDGKANTIDYTVETTLDLEEGIAFPKDSVCRLFLEDLYVNTWNTELFQWEASWEMDGCWNFELTMKAGDWTEIEFVSEPITTNLCYGFDMDGNDVFRDETITSIKLRAFGAAYSSPNAGGQLEFANYKEKKFPVVVLKDGKEIRLNGLLELYDSWTGPIPMSEVECLKLIDGTVLYPVSTVTPICDFKQTQDGYTLELKSAVTDGRNARILFSLTVPQGTPMCEDNCEYSIGFGNFGNFSILTPQNGAFQWSAMGEFLEAYEDGDGRKDTVAIQYTMVGTSVKSDMEWIFSPGETCKLCIHGMNAERMEYKNGELTRILPLWNTEEIWECDITFSPDSDTELIEFLDAPMDLETTVGGAAGTATMTSFQLGSLGAKITWQDDLCGDLHDYNSKLIRRTCVVLMDGTRIPLDGAEYLINRCCDPILLDQVVCVELFNGTRLYPQGER